MIFYVEYQCDRDKQSEAQTFFANMTDEQIAGEIPNGLRLICRYHDLPNGSGFAVVETDSQDAITAWALSWSGLCTFPVIKTVVDDDTGRKMIREMLDKQ